MNEQNFGDPVIPVVDVKPTSQETYSPVLNSDPSTGVSQVDAVITHEVLMGTTFVAVDPLGGTTVHEAPMSTFFAAVNPLDETIVVDAPLDKPVTYETPVSTNSESSLTLLDREESELLRTRWNEIQGRFVDEPRSAVQQADTLVSEVVEKITRLFASEHASLESQWNQGMDVSTEDLRKALQHYRSFFNRLVGSI